jgi:hypothetical protein
MDRIFIVSLFAILTLPTSSYPQIKFEQTLGDSLSDLSLSVQQTSDNGYIIVGWTESKGAGGHDVYLVKTDSLGDTLWTRTYGGTLNEEGRSVQQTTDNGFIILGWTESFGAGGHDLYLIKTNSLGVTIWTKTYGGVLDDEGWTVQQTLDGGYILTGSYRISSFVPRDVYLLKTNTIGDSVWAKVYITAPWDEGRSVQQTSDGGYIIAGCYMCFSPTADIYQIKTDTTGETLWTKTHGGANSEFGWSVQETSDSGFIIAGWTQSFGAGSRDAYLIKTSSSGATSWTKTYGGILNDEGHSVQETSDGGFILTGLTQFSAGGNEVYLIKTSSSGDTTWTKTYGGSSDEEGNSVQQTTDGGYVIAGWTQSYGAGLEDVYLIKTDENGSVGIEEEENYEYQTRNFEYRLFQNSPNPFYNSTVIHYQIPIPNPESRIKHHVSLKVYDITGRFVETLVDEKKEPGVYQLPISNHQLPSNGVYFYQLKSGDFIETKKLILLR